MSSEQMSAQLNSTQIMVIVNTVPGGGGGGGGGGARAGTSSEPGGRGGGGGGGGAAADVFLLFCSSCRDARIFSTPTCIAMTTISYSVHYPVHCLEIIDV